MTIVPRIYVACLAAYNNGLMHGDWVEVNDVDSVNERIKEILATSPVPEAEEWAIHDHEDLGHVREYESIVNLVERAAFIELNGQIGLALLEETNGNLESAKQLAENCLGSGSSFVDWVEEFYRETNPPLPEHLDHYIDWKAMARDWRHDFTVIESKGETYVFSNY